LKIPKFFNNTSVFESIPAEAFLFSYEVVLGIWVLK